MKTVKNPTGYKIGGEFNDKILTLDNKDTLFTLESDPISRHDNIINPKGNNTGFSINQSNRITGPKGEYTGFNLTVEHISKTEYIQHITGPSTTPPWLDQNYPSLENIVLNIRFLNTKNTQLSLQIQNIFLSTKKEQLNQDIIKTIYQKTNSIETNTDKINTLFETLLNKYLYFES